MSAPPPPEPLFDRFPTLSPGAAPAEPMLYDASVGALRQRSVNFIAKRMTDMMFVSGLDQATARTHLRLRAAAAPAGLAARPLPDAGVQAALDAAAEEERLTIEADPARRAVTVRWQDATFGTLSGTAIAPPGWGGVLLGPHPAPRFDPAPIPRAPGTPGADWPLGDAVATSRPDPALAGAADALFAACPGLYGVLAATPDRIFFERYSGFGAADRVTPSWSMTKALTATMIGRLAHQGWIGSVQDPVAAPLWTDPRGIHRLVTYEHLLRMRGGLAMPVQGPDGRVWLGFENSAVYQDAADAFETAQRSVIATVPGAVFRYVNSGINVLGAALRGFVERRGLAYPAGLYGLLADPIGMRSYCHSADMFGNMIASGAGFATLRDYAKLGVLYLRDGVWAGERLLPAGWADWALTPSHSGTSYAACFRSNADGTFAELPRDVAWASGASDQRVFICRRAGVTVALANETDHPVDLPALGRFVAAAMAAG